MSAAARAAVAAFLEENRYELSTKREEDARHLFSQYDLTTVGPAWKTDEGGTVYSQVYDDAKAPALIERAKAGDKFALATLRTAAAFFAERGKIPANLRDFAKGLILEKRPRMKRGQIARPYRDRVIVVAVRIATEHGVNATRGEGSRRDDRAACGCSIVSEALRDVGIEIEEDRVKDLWESQGSLWEIEKK